MGMRDRPPFNSDGASPMPSESGRTCCVLHGGNSRGSSLHYEKKAMVWQTTECMAIAAVVMTGLMQQRRRQANALGIRAPAALSCEDSNG
jgi:hypothetical protein